MAATAADNAPGRNSMSKAGHGFHIDDSLDGRWLVIDGQWSAEAAAVLACGDADSLCLNYARGFAHGSLEFLDTDVELRRLDVLDRSIRDLSPIERLEGLEELSVQAAAGATLDLSRLSGLRSLAGDWSLIGQSLGRISSVQRIVTWDFNEADLHPFSDQRALTRLVIKDAGRLRSLAGLAELGRLESVKVALAPSLSVIDEVTALDGTLQELEFEACPGLQAVDPVGALLKLRVHGVSDCGDIASFAPLRSLQELSVLYAWGSTRVVDGDLSPLGYLPKLREIRMRNRKHYRPAVGEFSAAVF